MDKLLILFLISFSAVACQTAEKIVFQDTRVILEMNKDVEASQIKGILEKISGDIQIESMSLIRKGDKNQLIVNVHSCKNPDYWLTELNDSKQIRFAEIDSKKKAN